MKNTQVQELLLPDLERRFPSTRYQGSKAKLCDWIWNKISEIDFHTCLDAFGGTGVISYRLKSEGKQVTYNDILKFNYTIGKALIENSDTFLSQGDVEAILTKRTEIPYPTFIYDTFADIYYTNGENQWLDIVITNISLIRNESKRAIAFYALAQACIVKRPYNLFHRKNLYIRQAEVERSFGNKASWDKPFEDWFRLFVEEANNSIFSNGENNRAVNSDAVDIPNQYDLVYIDTPYISTKGTGVNYRDFYHFLEGIMTYKTWDKLIDNKSKHKKLISKPSAWNDKRKIFTAFDKLFKHYSDSVIVVSYRSDGIPSIKELENLLLRYKNKVQLYYYDSYKYVLSTNTGISEVLLVSS
jgi:adenine-specific DNA methylase